MSIKEKHKTRKDYSVYLDRSEMAIRSKRPNLYKLPAEREKLNKHFFNLSQKSEKYPKETRIKGIDRRVAKEIALTSWL